MGAHAKESSNPALGTVARKTVRSSATGPHCVTTCTPSIGAPVAASTTRARMGFEEYPVAETDADAGSGIRDPTHPGRELLHRACIYSNEP